MSLSRKNLICTAFVVSHLFSSGNASFTTTSDILSDFIIPLPKDNWSLRSNDLVFENLTAQVPGDLLSDLMRNRLIDDPYVDRNFLIQRSVWMGESLENSGRDDIVSGVNEDGGRKPRKRHSQRKRTWIYSTTFDNNFDLNDAYREPEEGSGQFGMYFRINGAVIMARGANFIPMDQLEGRLSSNAHKIAVKSASKANMNMLRVWGGGMVPLDAFYDACDEEGILIYHDMMFVEEAGHRPLKTNTISQEIRHLVRSLASHPSLLVWNGCNECEVVMGTPSEIYASFVMEIVAEEDDTRPIWPSSPSKHGWKSGVRRLDSRPLSTNRNLTTWEPNAFSTDLESHGPYMRSFSHSYPGVNGIDVHFPYCNTPPKLREVDIGQEYPNQFVSEFGSSTMSSFESMTGTLTNRHWGLHGGSDPDKCNHEYGNRNRCNGTNVMAERSSLFADQIVACGEGDLCYVRNDHIASVKFAVVFEAWDIEDTTPLKTFTYRNELAAGSIVWFKLPDDFTSSTQVVLLELNVQDDYLGAPGLRTSETVYLKDVPKRIKGLRSPVRIEILEIHQTMNGYATLVLRSDKLALFVVLTTRAEGVFSDNAFFLRPFENKTVEFQSLADGVVVDLQVLKTTLRIEHLGLYSASGSSLSEN
eukprot:jgi/Psemu1/70068/estExt_Genemark1.C_13600007